MKLFYKKIRNVFLVKIVVLNEVTCRFIDWGVAQLRMHACNFLSLPN